MKNALMPALVLALAVAAGPVATAAFAQTETPTADSRETAATEKTEAGDAKHMAHMKQVDAQAARAAAKDRAEMARKKAHAAALMKERHEDAKGAPDADARK